MDTKEIQALVSLLDDEDTEVLAHVEKKIISLGNMIIPFLESEWENSFHPHVQKRIEDLIHTLQYEALKDNLEDWRIKESNKLLKGVWLIATYQYPDLEYNQLKKDIDKIYQEVWMSHRAHASPHDQIKNLNNVFFSKLKFASNTQNFHSPSNSMLNIVLESRKGNPISLCVLYMLVAKKLKLPVYGVNLPNLFVLTYKSDDTQFYINVFNKGLIFSRSDIDSYLQQLKLKPLNQFYEPCSHLEIVQRIFRNLILSFEKLGEVEKVQELKVLLEVISDKG